MYLRLANFNTNSWRVVVVVLLALSVVLGCSVQQENLLLQKKAEPIKIKPLPAESWKLSNGLQVVFYRDSELPLVYGSIYFKGGGFYESREEKGVTTVMGAQMRQGGAGPYPPDKLDLELEKLSAGIGSGFGDEYGRVSFKSLSGDFKRVFKMFADVVRRPRFDQKRLELWKSQALESIRRRKDDPMTVAAIAQRELLFGDSILGRILVSADVRRISRLALLRRHRKLVHPGAATLVIVGDVQRESVKKAVQKEFSDWEARRPDYQKLPDIKFKPTPGIYMIKKPFTQASIYIGTQGVRRLSPDHYTIIVFNEIFGSGSFSSKLFRRVRTELGLTYGVWGSINPGMPIGYNTIALKTKSQSTATAIVESLKVLKNLQDNPPTLQELDHVKNAITNSFVFKFENPRGRLERRVMLKLLGYPDNYDQTYLENIGAVKPEQVSSVARRLWDLKKLVIVVVGNDNAYNSIVTMLQNPPEILKGYKFYQAGFDEKLRLSAESK
ncbi:MAG: insulinase family protein [Candidatus Dadabacteria bacterium]|nr:MAG: insulinase family protein [Candidatus Dadabacteria bacterium]